MAQWAGYLDCSGPFAHSPGLSLSISRANYRGEIATASWAFPANGDEIAAIERVNAIAVRNCDRTISGIVRNRIEIQPAPALAPISVNVNVVQSLMMCAPAETHRFLVLM